MAFLLLFRSPGGDMASALMTGVEDDGPRRLLLVVAVWFGGGGGVREEGTGEGGGWRSGNETVCEES